MYSRSVVTTAYTAAVATPLFFGQNIIIRRLCKLQCFVRQRTGCKSV